MIAYLKLATGALIATIALPAFAGDGDHATAMDTMASMMATGLIMPKMDPAEGRKLFASKGCVVCHSINGIGGTDAPPLDAEYMDLPMNPFDFAARMWRGAGAMVAMQEEELGGQIELDGEELASIIAFVHDASKQAKFAEADIPASVEGMMHHQGEMDHHADGKPDDHG